MKFLVRCPEASINNVASPLYLLPYINVPYPTDILFDEFPVRYVRGDLSMGGAGFPSAVWKWGAGDLTREMLNNLVNMNGGFNGPSGLVYIRTRTNRIDNNAWQNFSCQMYTPVLTGSDGSPQVQWVDTYMNVTVRFGGLVAL